MIRFLLLFLLLPGVEPIANKTDDLESSKESSPMAEDRVPVTTQPKIQSSPPKFRQHKSKEPASQILPSMDAKLSHLLEKSPLTAPAKVHSIHGERRAVSTSKQNGSSLHTSSMPHTGHTHSSKRSAVLRNGNAADLALKLKSEKATIPQARDIKIPTEKGLAGTEGLGWILLHEINMTMQGEGHIHSTVTTSSPELSTRAKDQQITPVKRPLKHGFSESPTENRKNVGSPTKPQHSRLLKNKSIIDLPSDLPPRTLENGSTSSFHVELPNITYVSSNVTFPAILLEKETVPNSHIASERLQISTTDVAEATKAVLGDQGIINSTEKMTLTSQGDRNNDISRPLLFEELDAHLTGETRPAHADGDSKVILKAHDIDLLKNLPNQSRRSNFSSTAIPIQPDSATQKLPVKLTSARPEIDIKTLTQALQIEKGSSHQALEEVQSQSNTQPGLGSTTKLRRPGNTSVHTGMQTKAEAEFTTVNPRKIHTHSQGHHSVINHGKIYKLTQPIFTSAQPATHQHDANKHLHFGQGSKTQTVPNIKKGESVTSKGAHKRAHQHSPTTKTDKMLSSMFPPGLHETATQTPPVKTTAALLGINWFGTSTQTDPGKVNMTQPGIGLIDSNKTAYTQGTSSIQEDLTSAKTIGSHPTVTERLLQLTTETLPELAKYSIAGQAMDRIPELVSHTNSVGSDWITPTISANSELSANSEPELSTTKQSVLTTKSRIESSSNRLPELTTKSHLEPFSNRQSELTTKSHLETSSNRQPELSSKRQAGPSTNRQHSELSTYSPLELSKWSQQELSTKRQLQLTKQNQTELSTYSHVEQPSQSRLPNKSKSELSTESWLVITTHKHFMSSTVAQSEFSTVSQTEGSTNNQLTLSTQKELEKSTKSNPDITANNQTAESESIHTEFSTNNQTTFTTNSYPFMSTRKQLEVTTETQSELPKISQTEIITMMQPEHSTDNLPELFTQKQLESSSPWYWDESTKSQLELSTQGHQDLLSPHNQPEHSTQSLPTPYTYNQTESSTTNHPVTILTLRTPLEADITTDIEPRSATPSPGRREPNVETAPSRGTEPYTFTQIYPWLSSIKNSGSQPELATQTASLGQTHTTTQSKTQLFTETQPRLITQTQGESSILDEQTNTNELTSTSTDKTQVTTTQHGPKWQTELTLEPRARSSKASETVADSHGDNVSETARNTSHSPSFQWDSGINPTWTHKDTSKSIANMLPATANGFNGLTTTEDAITMVARSGQGQISEVSHTVQLNPTLQLKTTTLTPRSLSDRGPVQPETDRIFIVDEQLPVFKVEAINVTYRMQLNMALSALCDQPDTCQALLLQEMASVYKAVPGFDRIEVQNITLDRMLEYRVQLRVEAASAMSDTLELALSDPTWLFRASHRSEDSFTSRVRSVSMAEDHADPCTDWLSCPLGFQCLSARSLGARCHSPCHSGFCHNRGICVHRKEQEPECQCPVGRDFWYMGQTCDYRMTHQRLTGIACAIVLCIIICAAAVVYILVRRFQTQILQQKLAQTQSSYRRFSRFDDVPTHFWCPSQTWLTASASLNSLDNPAFSSSEEVFPLQALGSCVCGCQEGAQKCVQTSPMQPPMGDPPRLETSGSSINDLMIDSGKASDVSVSSWPMEPIHWTPFPILHQLSLQSPFHARRPHSYFEGMELVNTERSWTA